MPHAALCVSRHECLFNGDYDDFMFQCRTQHCVCRDAEGGLSWNPLLIVSMPHAALCVSRQEQIQSVLCLRHEFQCRTQHCVCRDSSQDSRRVISNCFNAARSIVCVETLCPAALVPRGLRRHFGKTRFFAPFLASADELCPEKWGSHRRCPLCGAGCTVLERRNGGMRLCARAGALSISFSSYLMIAHASFFFNDVFASMQRGR